MITKEYAKAYKEVITILNYVPEADVKKIPQEKINFYRSNMDQDYEYMIDETKGFEEQELLEETKAILANIFRDYWATPYQKERIEAKERYDLKKAEEEKREKYNPDNIFKNKYLEHESIDANLPIEIKRKNFFQRLIVFIKKIIKR